MERYWRYGAYTEYLGASLERTNTIYLWIILHSTFNTRGVRMASCSGCGAMFTRNSNLKRHQKDRCKGVVNGPDYAKSIINNGINLNFKKRRLESPAPTSHNPNIEFLPSTVNGLAARFNEHFPLFWNDKKYQYRNELVSILDDLLRQDGITHDTYRKINGLLSLSIGHGVEESEEQDEEKEEEEPEASGEQEDDNELESKISDTLEYLIRHDRREIEELLTNFEKEEEEYFEDDIAKLRQLVETWIEEEILGKESVLDDIERMLDKLSKSSLKKSQLHRFGMILRDIKRNRFRVSDILRQMYPILSEGAGNVKEVKETLTRLLNHGLISLEQFNVLTKKMDTLDLDKFISQMKSQKIGRGLDFLPRHTKDLAVKLKKWASEFAKEGTAVIRKKVLAALDELLFRRAITNEKYKDIIADI